MLPSRLHQIHQLRQTFNRSTQHYTEDGKGLWLGTGGVQKMFDGCVRTMRAKGEATNLATKAERWVVKKLMSAAELYYDQFEQYMDPSNHPYRNDRDWARYKAQEPKLQAVWLAADSFCRNAATLYPEVFNAKYQADRAAAIRNRKLQPVVPRADLPQEPAEGDGGTGQG